MIFSQLPAAVASAKTTDEKASPASAGYAPNRLIVKYRQGTDVAQRKQAATSIDLTELKPIGPRGDQSVQLMKVPSGMTVETAMTLLKSRPEIEYAEPDYIATAAYTPNDTYFGTQWSLNNTAQTIGGRTGTVGADIRAVSAWDLERGTSHAVAVAVIDTGTDLTHPDLTASLWTNLAEIPGNGIDDDSNGFVDDVHGYNFVSGSGTPTDDYGHGTHVAGIIAAAQNNSVGISGISGGAKIMTLKALDSTGSGYLSDIQDAIYYATANGAKVINMSLSSPTDTASMETAVTYAHTHGVTVLAAAGNDGSSAIAYPGGCADAIAVGATNNQDTIASFSQHNSTVDISAPGVYVYSTTPTYDVTMTYEDALSRDYDYMSGTSMATPTAAGVAALVLARNPNLSPDQVEQFMKQYADDKGVGGRDDYYGYGRVNAYSTLNAVPPVVPGVIDHVTISPTNVSLAVGATRMFVAHAFDASNNEVDGSSLAWTTDAGTLDTDTGPAATLTAQTTPATGKYVTVTGNGATATANITVTLGPVKTISITPSSKTLKVGESQVFSAKAYDAYSNELTGISFAWYPTGGTLNRTTGSSVTYTAMVVGSNPITAMASGKSGTVMVTVKLPAGPHPNGMLIKTATQDTVYYLEAGKKRPITSWTSFVSWAFNGDRIVTVDPLELPSYGAGANLQVRPGMLVKGSGPGVYLTDYVAGVQSRRPIGSASAFTALGLHWEDILPISDAELTSYTAGTALTNATKHPNGMLIKTADLATVYYIEEGHLRPVTSWPAFVSNGLRGDRIVTVPNSELAQYPADRVAMAVRAGCLVKGSSATVYICDNVAGVQYKRPISSASKFNSLGLHWEDVITISDSELLTYQQAEAI